MTLILSFITSSPKQQMMRTRMASDNALRSIQSESGMSSNFALSGHCTQVIIGISRETLQS